MYAISIVVVLYKKHYSESLSLSTILSKLESIHLAGFRPNIYVWNNSPQFSPPLEHSLVEWIEGENDTLSYIYNKVAALSFSTGADVLMISDDDTDYKNYDFISNLSVLSEYLSSKSKAREVGCFIPLIYSDSRLVSPGGRFFFKGYLLRNCSTGLVRSRNLLAINSGMLVTRACYEKMQPFYDGRLRFYGTDTDFFVRYQKAFKHVYVLNSRIDHSLSSDTEESLERALFRWRDNLYALRLIFEDRILLFRAAMTVYHFSLKLKLAIKFRDSRFIWL
ncbi:hypothetical protein D3C77_265250 [compost metagenome]